MDKFREADDIFIDEVMLGLHKKHEADTYDHHDNEDESHSEDDEDEELDEPEEEELDASTDSGHAWQPRRAVNQEDPNNVYDDHLHTASSSSSSSTTASSSVPIVHNKRERDLERDNDDLIDSNDTEIDANLLPMYRRGLELQLNKMHYASDQAYEEIMEDININGMSQHDIFDKYHIHFIPDEASFRLIAPPSIINRDEYDKMHHQFQLQPTPTPTALLQKRQYTQPPKKDAKAAATNLMKRQMSVSARSKRAFENFYALTRMQQKYLSPTGDDQLQSNPEHHTQTAQQTATAAKLEESGGIALSEEDMSNLKTLREIHKSAPVDILSVVLNDQQLPQWLYEGDTILDLNCGIGDALIHLLHNFTTIRGICVVGTSPVKYKYAKLNVQLNGLTERIEVVQADLYDPYVRSRFNVSDIVYVDWYNGDDEYLEKYFIAEVMNDHDIREAKPGRVIISYNKLLFDERTLQASYSLHFARNWHLNGVHSDPLSRDVSLYLYSVPFYLSRLSNMYVQKYHVFYGYQAEFGRSEQHTHTDDDDTDEDEDERDRSGDGFHFVQDSDHDDVDDEHNHTQTLHDSTTTKKRRNTRVCASDEDAASSDCHDRMTAKSKTHSKNKQRAKAKTQTTYIHFDKPLPRKMPGVSMDIDLEKYVSMNDQQLFEVIASVMNVGSDQVEFAQPDEVENIWDMISSQLLYQSFVSGIQNVIQNYDVAASDKQSLVTVLNAINERQKTPPAHGKTNGDQPDIQQVAENEWQYLRTNVFNLLDVCTFPHVQVLNEWKIELDALLKEFASEMFYEAVTQSAYLRLQSVLDEC